MYYYLSFLRPPPHTSSPGAPITITPQVSNDLRTEPYPSSLDIFYHWTSASQSTRLTEPTKLTTWRPENAYKALTVPPPPSPSKRGARSASTDTEACLMLTAHRAPDASIDLRADVGKHPLPVSSLPVRFTAKSGPGKAAKQEAIVRAFRVNDGAELRVKEMTSFDLDKKLWDSGIGLSAWLAQLSSTDWRASLGIDVGDDILVRELRRVLFDAEECDAIELGAGTGMVSLVLAALRSSIPPPFVQEESSADVDSPRRHTRILSTDLPSSIELMEHNISLNASLFPGAPPTALTLDWDAPLPASVLSSSPPHIIIMADVTYNTASFPALLRTLSALLGRGAPLVLLAYKERDPAERALWDMLARDAGVVLQRVGTHAGAGGQAVEVWAGRRAQGWTAPAA
ncbi:hypothetical protein FA95DRAFT_1603038 [Auriscalpium vulgare]|uniref:Uncharacterized protein n=1 Tax=Auriscalpium vulgare TaxID=40419 RepID=A0ACB8S4A3_9AGAM|nr:hypothetical protein FA95DRAFT_1603038 [Auriscalpium vulgare]